MKVFGKYFQYLVEKKKMRVPDAVRVTQKLEMACFILLLSFFGLVLAIILFRSGAGQDDPDRKLAVARAKVQEAEEALAAAKAAKAAEAARLRAERERAEREKQAKKKQPRAVSVPERAEDGTVLFDVNNDGVLDLWDLKKVSPHLDVSDKAVYNKAMYRTRLHRELTTMDKNGDGKVSDDEKYQAYRAHDLDQDGRLSEEEAQSFTADCLLTVKPTFYKGVQTIRKEKGG